MGTRNKHILSPLAYRLETIVRELSTMANAPDADRLAEEAIQIILHMDAPPESVGSGLNLDALLTIMDSGQREAAPGSEPNAAKPSGSAS
jgi:hypothetical protein